MTTTTKLRKAFKYLGRTFEVFFAFLFFYLVFSTYGGVIPTGELKDDGELYIYVQSNGVHTDICLPSVTEDINWLEFLSPNDYSSASCFDFVAFGWGDKGFFLDTPTWTELKVSTALNAAFLPSSTAMHVAYSAEPELTENRAKVYMDRAEYKRLIAYIKRSFCLKNNGVQLIPEHGYAENDNFYEANNSYHLFRTCNSWTNDALKVANVKTGIYALFPDGILSHLKR